MARLEGHEDFGNAVAWHPDGQRLATAGDDGTVRIWDAASYEELTRVECSQGRVLALAWHPNGTSFASAGGDGTVKLWNATTCKTLGCLEGHLGEVLYLAWHPDGGRLASSAVDGTVRLWNVTTHEEIACVIANEQGLHAISYAIVWQPNGKRLASVGPSESVRFWDATGLARLGDRQASDPVRLGVRRPDSDTVVYLPLAGLREVFHGRGEGAAGSGDDLLLELAKLGFDNGVPWDGEEHFVGNVLFVPSSMATGRGVVSAAPTGLVANSPPPAATPPIKNPFRPGPALTDAPSLPGRAPILSELLALIDSRSPAVLRGPRRSGKTTLLYHLKTRLSPTRPVRHRTLEGRSDPLRTADDLALFLDPTLRTDPTPAETLRLRLASHPGTVLLLDEIANLGEADASVFAWLRAVGQENTSVVLAGSPYDWVRVVERAKSFPGSSFGNDVTPVTLGPLAPDDAIRFLVDTAPPDVPLPADTTARWIVERCGPWPFYLQVMGFAVVQAVRAGQRRALVHPDGISDLYEQRLLLDRDIAAFGGRWAELPERAQRVLRGLRGADLPRYRDLPPDDRRALRDTGLCNAHGHWLPDAPFYDWIRRIGDIDEGKV